MSITRNDVARHSNVSSATVSRVLNNDLKMSKELRNKVLKSIKELNYMPDQNARRLNLIKQKNKTGVLRTNNFGCVVGGEYVFSDPFFSRVLEGMNREAIIQGYHPFFINTERQLYDNEPLFAKLVNAQNIDGIILIGLWPGENTMLDRILERCKNVVTIMMEDCDSIDGIAPDMFMGGYTAVKYLASHGHKRIGFVGYHSGIQNGRFDGYKIAMQEPGLEYDESIVEGDSYYIEDGYKNMLAIIERSAGRMPTAVFAVADRAAIGAVRAVKEKGMKVPDDISVISFDDINESENIDPPLTTIRVDKEELGRLGVKKLIERISNPGIKPVKTICPVELIERKSVKTIERI